MPVYLLLFLWRIFSCLFASLRGAVSETVTRPVTSDMICAGGSLFFVFPPFFASRLYFHTHAYYCMGPFSSPPQSAAPQGPTRRLAG
ncbi:hypothetical protein N658DRAFT_495434 [Parathielavia hyrcaniae]|uniref:Secreted protein n=1 Tax=Parathielavia hyrcaniae TaxID=113614 RepID=A0AAN6T2X4_9PEZI|nr:hypothetical protein N658DRAFT_495434 [Parathielavia hyrcaniae]